MPTRQLPALARILLFLFSNVVILILASALSPKSSGVAQQLSISLIAAPLTYALTVVFTRWERLPLRDVGAVFTRASLRRFALGFLLGLLVVAISALHYTLLAHPTWTRTPGTTPTTAALIFLSYILLAAREELAFRGYPLRRLATLISPYLSVLVLALLFAFEHKLGGWPWSSAILGAGVGALTFGLAAISTRGLAIPIGLHAAWNFGDWLIGGEDIPGLFTATASTPNAAAFRTTGYVLTMSLTGLAFLVYSGRRRPANQP